MVNVSVKVLILGIKITKKFKKTAFIIYLAGNYSLK